MSVDGVTIFGCLLVKNIEKKVSACYNEISYKLLNSSSYPRQKPCCGFQIAACDSKLNWKPPVILKIVPKATTNVHSRKSTN